MSYFEFLVLLIVTSLLALGSAPGPSLALGGTAAILLALNVLWVRGRTAIRTANRTPEPIGREGER